MCTHVLYYFSFRLTGFTVWWQIDEKVFSEQFSAKVSVRIAKGKIVKR